MVREHNILTQEQANFLYKSPTFLTQIHPE